MATTEKYLYEMTDLEIARKLVEDSRPHTGLLPFAYHGPRDLGKTAAIVFSYPHNSDDSIVLSNFRVAREILTEEFPDQVGVELFGGFLGNVDNLIVDMLTPDGELTKAGERAVELLREIDRYPLLSDEDHSELLDERPDMALSWYGFEEFISIYGPYVYRDYFGVLSNDELREIRETVQSLRDRHDAARWIEDYNEQDFMGEDDDA